MTDDLERWIVTHDPEKLADLQVKAGELSSFELAEYAMNLGLYPADYAEGQRHSIEIVIPPGHEGPPLLAWTAGLPSIDPEDITGDDDEYDDYEVWGDIVGVEEAPVKGESDGDVRARSEDG